MIIINNSGGITMRKPEEIRAEIDKLTKELEAVKIHEAKRDAAVHILTNLGWTHSPLKGWQKPEPKRDYKEFDKDTMSPYKSGDYLYSYGAYYRVADVHGKTVRGQRVLGAGPIGCWCSPTLVTIPINPLTRAVKHEEVLRHFK